MLFPGMLGTVAADILRNLEPLKITKIETVRFDKDMKVGGRSVQWMWVRIHTNNGLVGTGATYTFNEAN